MPIQPAFRRLFTQGTTQKKTYNATVIVFCTALCVFVRVLFHFGGSRVQTAGRGIRGGHQKKVQVYPRIRGGKTKHTLSNTWRDENVI